jgi:hypothetical protein
MVMLFLACPLAAQELETPPESNEKITTGKNGLSFKSTFGSYGRAQVRFDKDGNTGRNTNVIAHGPRLFEQSYAELDFKNRFSLSDGFATDVVITLALFEPLAHYSGIYGGDGWALRNLYAEVSHFLESAPGLRAWAGSRMYRGDDIYLLDYWPLDNLNTVGGGFIYEWNGLDIRLHAGVNRLENDYQFQAISVSDNLQGATDLVLLDRQRLIASFRTQYTLTNLAESDLGMKFVAYGEYHRLPTGQRIDPNLLQGEQSPYPPDAVIEPIAGELGFVVGAEISLFGFGPSSHLNLFGRYAQGLAAYGETGIPFGTNTEKGGADAMESLVALSFNWENDWMGLMAGGYIRWFQDADGETNDADDFVEGGLVARPLFFVTDHFHQAFEVSYQRHHPMGLNPASNLQDVADVVQLTIMEILSLGKGSYQRPQIRLYYTLSLPNEAARDQFPEQDRRAPSEVEHFIGLGAEWWFNSSTYF